MTPISHPGRLLKRELEPGGLSANRLALDIGVASGRVTHILDGRRSITADTAIHLGLQSQYDIARSNRSAEPRSPNACARLLLDVVA